MSDTVAEILATNGIRLKRLTAGAAEHVRCPKCEGGKSREVSLSVTIDQDGEGVTWTCHRGSCGWTGGERAKASRPVERVAKEVRAVPPHTPQMQDSRPPWLWQFFDERNIGAKTVQWFGIYAVRRRFPDPVGESDSLVFPFKFRGEVVNRKYRPYPAKNPMLQEKDALPTLFNVDALGDEPDEVVWVEGEPDVMALHECGILNAVTLKDGAPAKVGDGSGARFAAVGTHADMLGKVPRFVLAGDIDPPGMALREELASRLGRHRCWLVTWPEGCKDACDALRQHGPEAVVAAVKAATPYPIEGLHKLQPGQLVRLRTQPPPPVMTTGISPLDRELRLPAEGRLIVMTGYPSSGKTSFARWLMIHTAAEHGRRWVVFSPEMQPWEGFMAECAEVLIGQPFWADGGASRMTDAEARDAERWLSERVTMLVCDAEKEAPTLEWIIDRARFAVLRDGATDLLIDPWNEVEHLRGDMSETDYVGLGLQRLKGFGLRHGVNVWVIAHPAKPQPLRAGEKRGIPGPYEIAGSAHWANRADLGITVHQPEGALEGADIVVWKARFRRFGKRGTAVTVLFEPRIGRYTSPDLNDPLPRWARAPDLLNAGEETP